MDIDTKTCNRCGEVKPVSEYHKRGGKKKGRLAHCKECSKVAHRAYLAKHREKYLEYHRNYYRENKERLAAQQKERIAKKDKEKLAAYHSEYYANNSEKIRKRASDYYAANREEVLEKCKITGKAYRDAHKEERAANGKVYYAEHKEQHRASCDRWKKANPGKYKERMLRRRILELEADGDATADQIEARWDYYGRRCFICGAPAEATDHVKPLARGGAGWPCNLRPICTRCNCSKGAKWPFDIAAARLEHGETKL